MAARQLVLWDIDHTLIDTRGVGRELSAMAFERVTGMAMRVQAKIDGITEPVIFRETAKLHGLLTGRALFERFAEALAEAHLTRFAELRERGHALPGAAAALNAMAMMPGVVQTVVTGNVRSVAETKLQVFGLDGYINWGIGAFGEDNDTRAELIRIALERAERAFGQPITPSQAVVIGDTPADVEAAFKNGVSMIAVASGRSSSSDLYEAGNHYLEVQRSSDRNGMRPEFHVLPNLMNTASVLALVRRAD
ncbi:haloacid dehalogenase-like hydrolase [Acrocarpospora sp. B8E8]|uniref:haloacid dehalogenase-like hydrolase n=1 Tax=Acrocarpospora sp. B8E8 TaxID=3153572 RepID=UPI00325D1C90